MSNLRNSVRLVGFLGSDPEVKMVANKKVARASIAVNEYHKNEKGETTEETQWYSLVMWDKTAILAENYLHKGSEISIEGRLKSGSYSDKAGVKKYFTEIVVNDIMFMGAKKESKA